MYVLSLGSPYKISCHYGLLPGSGFRVLGSISPLKNGILNQYLVSRIQYLVSSIDLEKATGIA
jgi:hypothetical protein